MSKLIEKLRKNSQAAPRRMGFGSAAAQASAPTPVVLMAALESLADLRAAQNAGAHAIFWQAGQTPDLSAFAEAARGTELPLGLAASSVAPDNWGALGEKGCDYLTLSLGSAARALDLQPMGLLLELPLDTNDLLLRTLEQLPVDAVVVADDLGNQAELTVQHLMEYQRLALLARRPLILRVTTSLSPTELGLLRDAGIQAILTPASSARDLETLGALCQALKNIPPRRRKREEHIEPLIPTPTAQLEPEFGGPEEIPSSRD